jgi:hypothetical protein
MVKMPLVMGQAMVLSDCTCHVLATDFPGFELCSGALTQRVCRRSPDGEDVTGHGPSHGAF